MQHKQDKQLSEYMQGLIAKRMQHDKTIKGFTVLKNGAVKFNYKAKADTYKCKALSSSTYETINNWSVK